MSKEANKAIVRRSYNQGVNMHDMHTIDEVFATDFVAHIAGRPEPLFGREAFKQQHVLPLMAAFPDVHVTIVDLVAEEDKVVAREVIRATHRGEFMGIPPTGRQITIAATDVYRIAGHQIAEEWILADLLSALRQLGAIPPQAGG